MRRLHSLLIGWLCASLTLLGAVSAVLPAVQLHHDLEHALLAGGESGAANTHEADSHSHDAPVVDLLSHLGALFDAAVSLASAASISKCHAQPIVKAAFDPPWIDAPAPTGSADPPDRPPRRTV